MSDKWDRSTDTSTQSPEQSSEKNPDMEEIELLLQQAVNLHQQGSLQEAEENYEKVAAAIPNNPDVEHYLGVVRYQLGKWEEAEQGLDRSLELSPDNPDAWNNLGIVAMQRGNEQKAISAFSRARDYLPDAPDIHSNLGNAYRDAGQLQEAEFQCRKALELDPDFAAAWNNLGIVLRQQEDFEQSEYSLHRALQLLPDYAEALNNLGIVLREQNKLQESENYLLQALQIAPAYAEGLNSLGTVLWEQGRWIEAKENYEKALNLDPAYTEAYLNLGILLWKTEEYEQAEQTLNSALKLDPVSARAFWILGLVYKETKGLHRAEQCFLRAVELDPGFGEAFNDLAGICLNRRDFASARMYYKKAIEANPENRTAYSNYLYSLHYDPDLSNWDILREHTGWEERFAISKQYVFHPLDQSPDKVLRVGFVSSDFGRHPVGFFLRFFFEHFDSNFLLPVCYSGVKEPDELTAWFRSRCRLWRDITEWTDKEIAQQINEDGIDILVDLSGHTGGGKQMGAFTMKPAPVQVSWLGYWDTTGLSSMDYYISDELTTPGELDQFFTEKVIRLARTRFCYTPPEYSPLISPAPAVKQGGITLGSFNNLIKVTPETISLWAEILRSVPDSGLILKWKTLRDRQECERIGQEFEKQGVNRERIELRPDSYHREMLQEYADVDIALDPFPFTGALTTCEALWMGVPVVSMTGNRTVSRQSYSILCNLGLQDLVAGDKQEYIRIVQGLSQNLDYLSRLRSTMRERMRSSPVMDYANVTRELEEVFRSVWKSWIESYKEQ